MSFWNEIELCFKRLVPKKTLSVHPGESGARGLLLWLLLLLELVVVVLAVLLLLLLVVAVQQ